MFYANYCIHSIGCKKQPITWNMIIGLHGNVWVISIIFELYEIKLLSKLLTIFSRNERICFENKCDIFSLFL